MKRPTNGRCAGTFLCALVEMAGLCLYGQVVPAQNPPEPAPAVQEAASVTPPRLERLAIGFRIRSFPVRSLSVMANNRIMTTVGSQTPHDWVFNTTSRSPRFGGGPAFEFRLTRRTTLTAELLFDRLRYDKVTDVYSGSDDPATSGDERAHTQRIEATKARLWDVPVMLHHRGLRSSGILSQLYVAGGITARTISRIRTTNKVTNSDGSTSSDERLAQPSRKNLIGAVVGVGFRFIDDFNIKVTPEIRYTRWSGATFALETTRSPKNQLEFGIGFTK